MRSDDPRAKRQFEEQSIAIVARGGLGGSTAVAAEVALALADVGSDVTLVAGAPVPRLDRLPGEADPPAPSPTVAVVRSDEPLEEALLELAARARERRRPLSLVHVHFGGSQLAATLRAVARIHPRPAVVVTLHGSEVEHAIEDESARRELREASAACDAVLTPSAHLQLRAKRAGITSQVCANFLDWPRWFPRNSDEVATASPSKIQDLRALFVGHLEPWKGPQDLLETASRLRGSLAASWTWIGEGSLAGDLRRRAHELGLGGSVRFEGGRAVGPRDYRAADLVVVPSRRESFGLVALEALACDRPLVAAAAGGLEEWLASWRASWLDSPAGVPPARPGTDTAARTPARAGERPASRATPFVEIAPPGDPDALAAAIASLAARLKAEAGLRAPSPRRSVPDSRTGGAAFSPPSTSPGSLSGLPPAPGGAADSAPSTPSTPPGATHPIHPADAIADLRRRYDRGAGLARHLEVYERALDASRGR